MVGLVDRDAVANDFGEFFTTHRQIGRVCFNGIKAEHLYNTHVRQTNPLEYVRLPSTRPASAAVSFAEKRDAWAAALQR